MRDTVEKRVPMTLFKLLVVSILIGAFAACDDEEGGVPDAPLLLLMDVDAFLARVCEVAALCPDQSSTAEQILACPAEILDELNAEQRAVLEQLMTFSRDQQDCIIACIGNTICDRFGVSVLSISDSDLMEPYAECVVECIP